jgi:phosphoglycerol transferase MdoB-like AlkP superfamily enzyme
MAMAQFARSHAAGNPALAHLVSTSKHRPYTFPAARGNRRQGSRASAVAYTDWAIADFLRRARARPWFKDTVFVITADHCAASAGKAALPVFRYHIPMWVYSPGNIAPGRFDALMGQVDIAPTLLGMLGMDYDSQFYGIDVFQQHPGRAYIGTYQLLGYLGDGKLVQLGPHRRVDTVRPAYDSDQQQPALPEDPALALQAISDYQTAAYRFTHGLMRVQR